MSTRGTPTPPEAAGDELVTDGSPGSGVFPITTLEAAKLDDPHMREAARYPRRVEAIIGIVFFIGILSVCAFGAAYTENAGPQVYAASLGIGLFCFGWGLTAWGKYLMPQGPFMEMRHRLASSRLEREAMAAALVERTGVVVRRRRVLGGMLAGGVGIFAVVATFPLIRSLGPKPGSTFFKTGWKKGTLLVDQTGRPISRTEMQVGGLITVFPQGTQNTTTKEATDQTVLVRVQSTDLVTMPGREDWAPDGYVAYSKVCTHLGCPVGLYEQELELLVCPCHQSMFNVRDGAFPVFGPAPRPLPQLPVYFDSKGLLRARRGFNQPVGPGFWSRTTQGNGKASAT